MLRTITTLLCLCLLATSAWGKARQVNDYHWTGVERIVAIGDIHGDYEQYMKVLTAAGLVDRRGKWAGGETHLVQTGDIPDRGPDTRKIIEHLQSLKKQARKDGGWVHALIGNHEAMNVYGDLRYVTAGEYEAFTGQNSKRYQELLWERTLDNLKASDPDGFAKLDLDDYRREWERNYPLGWNEHRQAWGVDGEFGQWVLDSPVAVKLNDTVFLHGGMSAKYCQASLAEISEQVHAGLRNYDFQNPGIVEDEFGPLWYRGLAVDSEEARADMLTAILERYDARRIVVGHTPTQGVVWPRFDGRVVLNDTGLARYYGGHNAFLEITAAGAVAHYGKQSLPLPASNAERIDYLKQVVALNPANAHLQSRLQKMMSAERRAANGSEASGDAAEEAADEAVVELTAEQAQIEAWLSPDNCR